MTKMPMEALVLGAGFGENPDLRELKTFRKLYVVPINICAVSSITF